MATKFSKWLLNSKGAEYNASSHMISQIGKDEKCETSHGCIRGVEMCTKVYAACLLQRSQHNVMADRPQIRVGLASRPTPDPETSASSSH
jgi:hypothetical protein